MSNFQSYQSFVPTENESLFAAGPSIRQESQVFRSSSVNGVVTDSVEQSIDRGNSGQLNPFHADDNWKATARTTSGDAATEITGDTLVTIKGLQGKISFFVSEGILQKTADGSFTEGAGPAPVVQASTEDFLPVSDEAMAQVNMLIEPLPQASLDSITATATGMASGRLSEASLTAQFATNAGISLEDSAARLTVLKAVYQSQADKALQTRHGIGAEDRQEFYGWCRANKQGQLSDAISRQLHGNDVSGWAPLANQWQSTSAPSLAALQAAGLPTRTQGNGPEVYLNGLWMSPKAAARAGLV